MFDQYAASKSVRVLDPLEFFRERVCRLFRESRLLAKLLFYSFNISLSVKASLLFTVFIKL